MVSGHLAEKNGYLYIILSLRKSDGKRGSKWFSTGLKAKGNKRKAEELLIEVPVRYPNRVLRFVFADKYVQAFGSHVARRFDLNRDNVAERNYYNQPITLTN